MMKALSAGVMLMSALSVLPAGERPRTPDHDDRLLIAEQAMNPVVEELYRQRCIDESKVPAYTLPPILARTRQEWEAERQNILRLFASEIYGPVPPAPDKLTVRTLSVREDALNGLAVRKELRIIVEKNGRQFDFDLLLYVPRNAKTPPPVFIGLNFSGNQYYAPEKDVRLTRGPKFGKARWNATEPVPDTWRSLSKSAWNFEEAVKRGYAVATACYGEICPDNADGFRKSIYTLFYDEADLRPDYEISLPELKQRPPRQLSALSAWAWGLIRMREALKLEPLVNADKAIAIGHSRLGKTALWAGANDPGFAGVISNNSGCLGAALSRRHFGETLAGFFYPHQFWGCANLGKYVENENALPVDQHQLLALIAPRGLFVASSSRDSGADPKGEFLAWKYAAPVWRLYGFRETPPEEPPQLGQPVGGRTRYYMKEGKHSITAQDWQQYYDFADQLFR